MGTSRENLSVPIMAAQSTVTEAILNASGQIRSRRLLSLLHHWSAARKSHPLPGWRDLDAAEMPGVLPIIWSWTYDDQSDRFYGRIAGDDIRAIFNRPIANATMEEYVGAWNYEYIYGRHKRVVTEPAIGIERGIVFRHPDCQLFGERVMLPLAEDGFCIDGIIGATSYQLRPTSFDGLSDLQDIRRKYESELGGTVEKFFGLS